MVDDDDDLFFKAGKNLLGIWDHKIVYSDVVFFLCLFVSIVPGNDSDEEELIIPNEWIPTITCMFNCFCHSLTIYVIQQSILLQLTPTTFYISHVQGIAVWVLLPKYVKNVIPSYGKKRG